MTQPITDRPLAEQPVESTIYQGQFGEYTIDASDRQGVLIYRGGLAVAAFCFAGAAAALVLLENPAAFARQFDWLYGGFCLGIGVSLLTIHIYMKALHRLLQVFWAIGCLASLALAFFQPEPLVGFVYRQPLSLFGVGFVFVALTGIYFKEAFCFNRIETKLLVPIVPMLLLGHLSGWMSVWMQQNFLYVWAILFLTFALRKFVQDIASDVGDKSVFDYLAQQRKTASAS